MAREQDCLPDLFSCGVLALLFTIACIPNVFGMGFFFVVTCACIGAGIYFQGQRERTAIKNNT